MHFCTFVVKVWWLCPYVCQAYVNTFECTKRNNLFDVCVSVSYPLSLPGYCGIGYWWDQTPHSHWCRCTGSSLPHSHTEPPHSNLCLFHIHLCLQKRTQSISHTHFYTDTHTDTQHHFIFFVHSVKHTHTHLGIQCIGVSTITLTPVGAICVLTEPMLSAYCLIYTLINIWRGKKKKRLRLTCSLQSFLLPAVKDNYKHYSCHTV